MTFYIYNEKGIEKPYTPEAWQHVGRRENVTALNTFDKRAKDNGEKLLPFEQWMNKRSLPKKAAAPSTTTPLLASQIMTKNPFTLFAKDSLKKACNLFSQKRLRHIPIISQKKHVVGILSDRGVSWDLVNRGHTLKEESRSIREVMTKEVLCATENTEVSHIAKVCIDEQIGCMPIIDNEKKLIGIITRTDILKTIVKVYPREIRC